jgi:ribosomal protein S18 acetylase RimI-like enzyme
MSLTVAAAADLRAMMAWFPDAGSTRSWGGPMFRFPFTYDSFIADAHWPEMASWCLHDGPAFLAFGQYYERFGRINLARLAVHPERRGCGIGKRLLAALMRQAASTIDFPEFSLFVYRENDPAIRCYTAMGFRIAEFPPDAPLQQETYYMVCGKQYNAEYE